MPIDNSSPEYKLGEHLGHELAEGYSANASEELAQYVQQLQKQTSDPNVLAEKGANIFAGMRAADPTDVKIRPDGRPDVDWYSEIYVNYAFANMDKFSTSPKLKHPENETPDAAIQNANKYIAKHLVSEDRETFVADFNRRRLENNYLPNYEAYIDSNDGGRVKIRQVRGR